MAAAPTPGVGDHVPDSETDPGLEAHLRAGVAVYNAGGYHAAHDAWEQRWLSLDSGDEERFLHGLIQFTAAVHHASEGNRSGATGLADSAREYLAPLPAAYHGVDIAAVRASLADLAADPTVPDGTPASGDGPLALTHEGEALVPADLDLAATRVAATVLAEEAGYDEETIERAGAYARADLDDGRTASPFVTLLFDFVRRPDRRDVVAGRLAEHARRRHSRETDVDGLFD